MKTNEQLLERYNSPETIDIFDIQKTILVAFLPFESAKDFLELEYVNNYDDLPEDEKWVENLNAKEQIVILLPTVYNSKDNFIELRNRLLALKTFIWVDNDEFYKEIEPFFNEFNLDNVDDFIKKVSNQYGYKPSVEDIEFEEISND